MRRSVTSADAPSGSITSPPVASRHVATTFGSRSKHGSSGTDGCGATDDGGDGSFGCTSPPDPNVGSGVNGEDAVSSKRAHPAAATTTIEQNAAAVARRARRLGTRILMLHDVTEGHAVAATSPGVTGAPRRQSGDPPRSALGCLS
ncbi:hypothetical protein RE943_31550 [Prescottella equi]|nr:hypothetical protein RE9414_32320 [Prescottella equi]BCN59844.1 hypothetical protein RE9427_32140 [Prescottella equi]BCN69682.1 hypothetical protein RE943_31550 [Prescottella equi]BDC73387.1 hypothetical protein KAREA_33020 [Prescottella equi]BDE60144.1 hypothetical protein REA19_31600 [Prescottella equi]